MIITYFKFNLWDNVKLAGSGIDLPCLLVHICCIKAVSPFFIAHLWPLPPTAFLLYLGAQASKGQGGVINYKLVNKAEALGTSKGAVNILVDGFG